jgi:hypothetical protein
LALALRLYYRETGIEKGQEKLMKTLARAFLVIFFSGLFPVAGWPQEGVNSALIEGAKSGSSKIPGSMKISPRS